MKGQYRIIVEIVLILMGILITSFVLSSFTTVQTSVKNISSSDGFSAVANNVLIGLMKASENNNTLVRVDVPEKIYDHIYEIRIQGDELSITSLVDENMGLTRKIFNITSPNRIIPSRVVSSAGTIEILNNDAGIVIRRANL